MRMGVLFRIFNFAKLILTLVCVLVCLVKHVGTELLIFLRSSLLPIKAKITHWFTIFFF